MKKMFLITIMMFLFLSSAYGAMQTIQIDSSCVYPAGIVAIDINKTGVNYTIANYNNTLFIDANFFNYYFGITPDVLNNNLAYGVIVTSGNSQILCVPLLPVLDALGLSYTNSNIAGKYTVSVIVPDTAQQPANSSTNVTNNYYTDNSSSYPYYPTGLVTGIAIGSALNNDYYYRVVDVNHINWNRATFYDNGIYHSGSTVIGDNAVVHTGTTIGDNGNLINHTGVTWKNDGEIHHAGGTVVNGGGFHKFHR
jgi:hypothetical protein